MDWEAVASPLLEMDVSCCLSAVVRIRLDHLEPITIFRELELDTLYYLSIADHIVRIMPALKKYLGEIYLWRHVLNLPAAIAFAILFLILTIAHGWMIQQTRLWFCLPLFVGGICELHSGQKLCKGTDVCSHPVEVIGYVARTLAYNSTGSVGPFVVQAVFLLLPPVLFAATLYTVYARVVRSVRG